MDNYLDCTKAFAETMRDKYIAPGDKGNHLLFIARDSKNTIGGLIGRPKETAESLFGICMKNEQVRDIVLAVSRRLSGSTAAPKKDGQPDSNVGFIESAELFADTMKERYLDINRKLSLVMLAGNEEGVQLIGYGGKTGRLVSMASAIATEDWFKQLVLASMSLATLGSNYEDIKEALKNFHNDDTD